MIDYVKMIADANGDIDAVATKVAEELNKAIEQYELQKKNDSKMKDAQALAEHYNNFMKIYYSDVHKKDINGQDLIDSMGFVESIVDEFKDILPKETKKKSKKTLEDLIMEKGW